jgi:hypothetical protein
VCSLALFSLSYLFTTARHADTAATEAATVAIECRSGALSACLERMRLPPAASAYVSRGLRESQSEGLNGCLR